MKNSEQSPDIAFIGKTTTDIDAYMVDWKTPKLRQAHDVEKWVADPRQIDIQPNLEHFRSLLRDDDSILDVGCCAGYLLDYLGYREGYLGIDLFPEHVEMARALHPGREDAFQLGDVFHVEHRANVVFCSRVLIHLPRFEEAVKRLIECATRMVVVVIGVAKDVCHKVRQDGVEYYFREFSPATVKNAFGDCTITTFRPYSNVVKMICR